MLTCMHSHTQIHSCMHTHTLSLSLSLSHTHTTCIHSRKTTQGVDLTQLNSTARYAGRHVGKLVDLTLGLNHSWQFCQNYLSNLSNYLSNMSNYLSNLLNVSNYLSNLSNYLSNLSSYTYHFQSPVSSWRK